MQNPSSAITFMLDGEVRTIDFAAPGAPRPASTVLNYLRGLPGHKGTKEGCAEGDCGACTVVMTDLDDAGKPRYRAFDSCLIFLPMLQGRQLITVEHLGRSDALHPVQQAMVDTDGSQCGYCTPGFVMALFNLYKNAENPDRAAIDDALTGNLCRCTGYRPIVEAAARACKAPGPDRFSAAEPQTVATLTRLTENARSLAVDTGEQVYFRPLSLEEALELRRDHPDAVIVNGATDVGLLVTKQKQVLPKLLDLSGIAELRNVEDGPDALRIGAGVSLERVKALSEGRFPALYDMLAVFGSQQIRNVATLGGNLGTASPIGDTPPVLMALDATVAVRSLRGTRRIPALEFVTGYRSTALHDDELITDVILPKNTNGTLVRSYKISKRKDLDISTVSGGFRLDLNPDRTVKDILLVYGGMAAMTKRAAKAESFLRGKPWTRENAEAAMDLVEAEFTPITDARSGKDGRRVMARNLLLKFWADTTAR